MIHPNSEISEFDIIIIGATGDLSIRKIIPALFKRYTDGQIPEKSKIVFRRKLFRAGYDFLLLREKSGENVTKVSKWWSDRVSNVKKR